MALALALQAEDVAAVEPVSTAGAVVEVGVGGRTGAEVDEVLVPRSAAEFVLAVSGFETYHSLSLGAVVAESRFEFVSVSDHMEAPSEDTQGAFAVA